MQKITRVPKAQPYFKGVINLRGEVVPVMSLRLKMGLEDDVFTNTSRIIILKIEQKGVLGLSLIHIYHEKSGFRNRSISALCGYFLYYTNSEHLIRCYADGKHFHRIDHPVQCTVCTAVSYTHLVVNVSCVDSGRLYS